MLTQKISKEHKFARKMHCQGCPLCIYIYIYLCVVENVFIRGLHFARALTRVLSYVCFHVRPKAIMRLHSHVCSHVTSHVDLPVWAGRSRRCQVEYSWDRLYKLTCFEIHLTVCTRTLCIKPWCLGLWGLFFLELRCLDEPSASYIYIHS